MPIAAEATGHLESEPIALSPLQRVALTFAAPGKAFQQMGLSRSWWLPYLLVLLVSLGYSATIGARVGWETVARNNLANAPKQQARMEQAPPDQQAAQIQVIGRVTRVISYAISALGPLLFGAIIAGVLLATLNFGLGGHAGFESLFAVYQFSVLPQIIKLVLVVLLLFAGVGGESFQINNALGSNPAYYLQGSGAPLWLLSILSWVDLFTIWQITVLTIGCAAVARVSRGKAAAVVVGWTMLFVVVSAGLTLLNG